MNEQDLKDVLEFLCKLGACRKSINISDECECLYAFSYKDLGNFSFDKNTADFLPENVLVSFSRKETDDEIDEVTIEFYTKKNPLEVIAI